MNYATLTGEMEEKALIIVFDHYMLEESKDGKDFMRLHNGYCAFAGFRMDHGTLDAEMRTASVTIRVADGRTVWSREYKWPEFLQRARDAKTAHQTSLFEMMEGT